MMATTLESAWWCVRQCCTNNVAPVWRKKVGARLASEKRGEFEVWSGQGWWIERGAGNGRGPVQIVCMGWDMEF